MPENPRIIDAVAELLRGRPVVVIDDADRENEGDLVVAAEHIDGDLIAFMITYGRGLVCVAIDRATADRFELRPMVARNTESHGTAFTISIDGGPEHGVSSGVSANDRATTVRLLLDDNAGPADLRSPGHMFPLVAHPDGTRARRGHTEASVELCVLAGLRPAAVIVEILTEDGRMARADDLAAFARRHGLAVITVAEIAHAVAVARGDGGMFSALSEPEQPVRNVRQDLVL